MSWSRLALLERKGGVLRVAVEASGVVPLFLVVLREGWQIFGGDGGPVWEVPDPGGSLSVVVGHWEGSQAFADDTRELAGPGGSLLPLLGLALGLTVVALAKR